VISSTIRSTWRPFGPDPLDPELAAEGLKAEGLSTGSRNLPALWQAGIRITVNPEPDNLSSYVVLFDIGVLMTFSTRFCI